MYQYSSTVPGAGTRKYLGLTAGSEPNEQSYTLGSTRVC